MAQKQSLIKRLQGKRPILSVILIGLILFNLISIVIASQDKILFTGYWSDFSSLEKTFLDSQYVNKHATDWISDETAFSYAGGKLIQGTNPVLVVPDKPPLGKYLIGLSALIFDNPNIIVFIFGGFSLIALYMLSLQVLKDGTLSLIPVVMLSSEPLFKNQFIYIPLLDIFQLFFLLLSFFFFNLGLTKKNTFMFFSLACLFLGFFISTKFFITGFTVIAAWYSVLLLRRNIRKLIHLSVSLPISLLVLLGSYLRVFAYGYEVHELLGIQKWVYLYHQSFLILPLSVWPLLMLNKWYVWFGDKPVIPDNNWSITWPFITTLAFATLILMLFKKIPKNINLDVLLCWAILYLIFLSFGQVFSRYFLVLIPVLYIISTYGISEVVKKKLL